VVKIQVYSLDTMYRLLSDIVPATTSKVIYPIKIKTHMLGVLYMRVHI
jgi:hypothetical protein